MEKIGDVIELMFLMILIGLCGLVGLAILLSPLAIFFYGLYRIIHG